MPSPFVFLSQPFSLLYPSPLTADPGLCVLFLATGIRAQNTLLMLPILPAVVTVSSRITVVGPKSTSSYFTAAKQNGNGGYNLLLFSGT